MFGVLKHIALKLAIKINCLAQELYQLLETLILDWSNKTFEN